MRVWVRVSVGAFVLWVRALAPVWAYVGACVAECVCGCFCLSVLVPV